MIKWKYFHNITLPPSFLGLWTFLLSTDHFKGTVKRWKSPLSQCPWETFSFFKSPPDLYLSIITFRPIRLARSAAFLPPAPNQRWVSRIRTLLKTSSSWFSSFIASQPSHRFILELRLNNTFEGVQISPRPHFGHSWYNAFCDQKRIGKNLKINLI